MQRCALEPCLKGAQIAQIAGDDACMRSFNRQGARNFEANVEVCVSKLDDLHRRQQQPIVIDFDSLLTACVRPGSLPHSVPSPLLPAAKRWASLVQLPALSEESDQAQQLTPPPRPAPRARRPAASTAALRLPARTSVPVPAASRPCPSRFMLPPAMGT